MMAKPGAGTIAEMAILPFPVRANPAVSADGQSAILFGETGEIARAWCADGSLQWKQLGTKSYLPPGAATRRNAGLVASPVLDDSSVIGGAIRDSYYSAPPLFRFDTAQEKFTLGRAGRRAARQRQSIRQPAQPAAGDGR